MAHDYSLNTQTTIDSLLLRQYLTQILDIMLFLLVCGSVFFTMFPYFEGIFTFAQYINHLLILFYFILQATGFEKIRLDKQLLWIYFYFICLLMWELLSFLILSRHEKAQGFLVHKMYSFLLFYIFTQYLNSDKRINAFIKILVLCILWNIGVCIWEIFTLKHLPMSRQYNRVSIIPTGAFYNENDLSQIMLITIPILFFTKNKILSHLCSLIIIIFLIITIVEGSRLCLLTIFPFVLIHFIVKTNIWYKIIIIGVIIITVNHFFISNPSMRAMMKGFFERNVLSLTQEVKTIRDSSIKERLAMILLQIEEFASSKGVGVGLANYEFSTMYTRRFWHSGTLYAHNIFFQTLCDEGIIGILLSIMIFFSVLKYNVICRIRDKTHHFWKVWLWSQKEKQVALYVCFFVSSGIIGSMFSHHFWIILAYYYALICGSNEYTSIT